MKLTKDELMRRVDGFISDVIPSRIKNNSTRFAFAFIRPLIPNVVEAHGLWARMASVGLLDTEGRIDMDLLEKCVKSGFCASGVVNFFGVGFEPGDAEAFFAYAKQGMASA